MDSFYGSVAQVRLDSMAIVDMHDGKEVWGKSMDFDKRVLKVAIGDSTIAVMACDTTKKGKNTKEGYLYALNADGSHVEWQRKLDLSMSKLYEVTRRGVLLATTLKDTGKPLLTLADHHTGESLWTQYLYPVYINDTLDIVVGLDSLLSLPSIIT